MEARLCLSSTTPDQLLANATPFALGHVLGSSNTVQSVAVSEHYAVVGDLNIQSVYVYDISTGELLEQIQSPDPKNSNPYDPLEFGSSVAISGDDVVVGEPGFNGGGVFSTGAVYVFSASTGKTIAHLVDTNPSYGEAFGERVAISDKYLVATAGNLIKIYDVSNFALVNSIAGPADAVAIDGDNVAFGISTDFGQNVGSVHVYSASKGSQVAAFTDPSPQAGDGFGNSVAISDNVLVAGASGEGRAYIYDGRTFGLNGANPSILGEGVLRFGTSVAIDQTEMVISSPDNVYIYDATNPLLPSLTQTISDPSGTDSPQASSFGTWIALNATELVVGDESTAYQYSCSIIGQNGTANDLKFDSSGDLDFAWYDSASHSLKFASRDNAGVWSDIATVDNSGDDVGRYLSMAIDPFRKEPVIAYYDATKGALKIVQTDGVTWATPQTVDSGGSAGLYPSLQIESNGLPAIAYYRKKTGDLKVAIATDWDGAGGFTWQVRNLDTKDDCGRHVSLIVEPNGKFNGALACAYADTTTGQLRFIEQTTKGWSKPSIIDRAAKNVSSISLNVSPKGVLSVSYNDASHHALKYAVRKSVASSGWYAYNVTSQGNAGIYSSLQFSQDGGTYLFSFDSANDILSLEFAYNSTKFAKTLLNTDGGEFVSAASSPATGKITYVWHNDASNNLQVTELP